VADGEVLHRRDCSIALQPQPGRGRGRRPDFSNDTLTFVTTALAAGELWRHRIVTRGPKRPTSSAEAPGAPRPAAGGRANVSVSFEKSPRPATTPGLLQAIEQRVDVTRSAA